MSVVTRFTVAFVVLAGVLLASCSDGALDPMSADREGALTLMVSTEGPAGTAPALQPGTLRATLRDPGGGPPVLDTTLVVQPGTEADLTLNVPIERAAQEFLLDLVLRNDAGVEIYRAGPTTVVAAAGGDPVRIVLTYSGPGAGAVRLEISPPDVVVRLGDTVTLDAIAFGPDDEDLGSAPVEWITLDPLLISLVDESTGLWRAGQTSGTARIVAIFEPAGVTDTSLVRISPVPASIVVVSGDQQTGAAGSPLPAAVVVEVRSAQGLPIAGEALEFEAVTGGSVDPLTIRTNAAGQASVEWTLAPTTGSQLLTAALVARPTLTAAITADAEPGQLERIDITPDGVQLDALTASATLTATGTDVFGNTFPIVGPVWSSSDPGVATVSVLGRLTAVANGTSQVTASTGGLTSDPIDVIVEQIPVSATIAPPSGWVVPAGSPLTFQAVALDRLGEPLSGALFAWELPDGSTVAPSQTFDFVGEEPGTATITAILDDQPSVSASSTGEVIDPPPDAPSSLTAEVILGGEDTVLLGFELFWTDNSPDETRFWLERSFDQGSSWQTVDDMVPPGSESGFAFDDGPSGGWPVDVEVLHRVRACRVDNCSVPTVIEDPSVTFPGVPADPLAVFPGGDTSVIDVTWTDTNSFEDGYVILATGNGCSDFDILGPFVVGPDVESFQITGTFSNTIYQVFISAFNGTADSAEVTAPSIGTLLCETP